MRIYNIISNINFKNTNINVVYYNDSHGSIKNLHGFCKSHDSYYSRHKHETNYTLSGGDIFLDESANNLKAAKMLSERTDAFVPGNHDLVSDKYFNRLINKFKMSNKWVSANLKFEKETALKRNIKKSVIIDKNGERIGVIGISPLDYRKVTFVRKENEAINVQDLDNTIKSVRKEVKKLERQGIDKVFILAHTGEFGRNGEKYYKEFAKIGGVDVIIGGHDHLETNQWLLSERGEPVKVVATGRSKMHNFKENLDIFGILNLEFDDDGVLVKNKSKNRFVKIKENTQSQGEVLTQLKEPLKRGNSLIHCTEIGNLVADSNLWYVNKHTKGRKADFAFVNSGTIRANFDNKNVTEEDIVSVLPFSASTLIKAPITKKQILNTLNLCALSTSFAKITPGLMQVSGMEYTVNPDLTVSDVHILNSDGTVKYNLDDCDDDKEFICVYDTFLATGPIGLDDLKVEKPVEYFKANRQVALKDYLLSSDISDYKNSRVII